MVRLERALPEDAALFAAWEQNPATKEYILPYSSDRHAQEMLDPDLVYLRILDGDELAGFLILVLDSDGESVELRRIVVSTKGHGIGQSAISALEAFCSKELNRVRIRLDVFEQNLRGRYIYEKLGYEKFGESSHEKGKLLLYQKNL